ncbi:MAG TPA: hypothetical protein VFE46_03915 [Pirellulales bacterium]|jgi:hypothetical protein|nr:hypothetical protein [Pirellulales bacterium]
MSVFQECLAEIFDAGPEWSELRDWLPKAEARANGRTTQQTNAALAVITLSGASLAARPKLRQQLLILVPHFDAKGREDDSRCIAAAR